MRSLGAPLSATSRHAEWLTFAGLAPRTSSSFVAFSPKTIPHLPPIILRKSDHFKVRIASAAESTGEHREAASAIRTIQLTAMFGAWYGLNIYFNIFNKQILKVFPFPANVTAFQFGCGTVMVLTMWGLNLHPLPKLSRTKFLSLLPLIIAHTFGNLLTNVSLGRVSVSFTHTIKAMEPFFTVLFSSIFLGDRPNIWVVSSLFPIVCGVALASFTEASFNWVGFTSAMASNVTNQSRNVMSKKLMNLKEEPLDNINMFSILTVSSFFLLVPAAMLLEGAKLTPHYLSTAAAQGTNTKQMLIRCLLSGLCFHCYQQVSYMILQMINAVTHAVGNSVKRVVLIVSSVLFFKTPVSFVNSLGTAMALAGVFMYSQAKRSKPKLR